VNETATVTLGAKPAQVAADNSFAGQATVLLTCAPLFSQKTQLFPLSFFVLGIDTVERLIQPRFYNDDPRKCWPIQTIRLAGCRFLVAGGYVIAVFSRCKT
jgi:hypothetical protein